MIVAGWAALSGFLLAWVLGAAGSSALTVPLQVCVGVVTLIPFFRLFSKRDVDFCELIYAIALSYFVYFALSPRDPMSGELGGRDFPWLSSEHINLALLYVGMGCSMLLLGYYSRLPSVIVNRLPKFSLFSRSLTSRWPIYALYVIGIVFRLNLIGHGTGTWSTRSEEVEFGSKFEGAWSYAIGYISNFSLFAYILALTQFFASKRSSRDLTWVLWLVMFPLECFWAFLQGAKSHFIPILVSPLLAHNYLRGKASLRQISIAALAMVFLVFPIVSAYRNFAADYPIELSNMFQTLPKIGTELIEQVTTPESETHISKAPELISARTGSLLWLANVVQYVQVNGIIYGETLWQSFVVIIPTVLFPGKYEHLRYGEDLYANVAGFGEGGSAGIAIMQLGEFYLNFGLLGVFIGLFLQGVLYHVWQTYWIDRQGGPNGVALFILGWKNLAMIEYPIAVAYGLVVRDVFLLALIIWALSLVQKPQELSTR